MRPSLMLPAAAVIAATVGHAAPGCAQTRGERPAYGTHGQPQPEASDEDDAAAAQEPAPQDLARRLNLRPDQQGAFRDYQAAFRDERRDGSRSTPDPRADGRGADEETDDQAEAARLAAMTTPQRLDDAARQMDLERADFERVSAATRRLYAALDPGQRRTFDQLTAPRIDDEAPDAAPPPRALDRGPVPRDR